MGLERLILLLETLDLVPEQVNNNADVYVTAMGEQAVAPAMAVAESLRNELPGVVVVSHCGGGSFKSQMKKADRSNARYAVILGERSEEHTSELQSRPHLVCRLLLEKK